MHIFLIVMAIIALTIGCRIFFKKDYSLVRDGDLKPLTRPELIAKPYGLNFLFLGGWFIFLCMATPFGLPFQAWIVLIFVGGIPSMIFRYYLLSKSKNSSVSQS